ncbi:MAG TPA: trigger factor [Xanthobacteraceae bacterium]|jgi:trigger factor|nr:trigger factor [Xanthobacteraceae bacterium]
MQVTETTSEGLKREFRVTLPATELDARLTERLTEMKDRVRINGFRPGKVPVDHLRKIYGRAVMAETIEQMVRETNNRIVTDRGLKLAMEPKVTLPEDKTEVEQVITGKTDLSYTVAVEVVPQIALADFKAIKLEKIVADVTDLDVDEGVRRIAEQNRTYTARAEGAKAESGDRIVISFKGTVNGEAFEGGSGEDVPVKIGANVFLPGFEEQLAGIAAGETRTVNVTFPADYPNEKLAGQAASFEVVAKSVEQPNELAIDDAFAASLGLESLEKLKQAVKERIAQEYAGASRQKLKRQLLDRLDELHKFEAPPSLVEQEFANVWNTVLADLKSQNRTFEQEGTTEEKAREEYRSIADRRVRLGLVLAEIGDRNNIKVTEDEVSRAVIERARQYPGREREVWDYYQKNYNALASVRAPIFEEKVVDFIVELADVAEKKVTKDELFREDEEAASAN